MTAQQRSKLLDKAADGALVVDLTESAGWTDVVRPALQKHIDYLKSQVITRMMGGQTCPQTPSELAAQAFGLQFALELIEKILKDGTKALEDLRAEDYQHSLRQ